MIRNSFFRAVVIAISFSLSSSAIAFAVPKPTQAEIDAAKKAEAAKKAAADKQKATLDQANKTLRQLTAKIGRAHV